MTRARDVVAGALVLLLGACAVAAVLVAVVDGVGAGIHSGHLALPFLAAAVAAALLIPVLPRLSAAVGRLRGRRLGDPYSALAGAARQMRAGRLDEVLPGFAELLAEGTAAARAAVWLPVADRIVEVASSPADGSAREVGSLAELLAEPDTDSVVPVLDGGILRAALVITKPAAITAADRLLLRDLAGDAALLLRVVALNVELEERVRRADDLAGMLQASRRRLESARDRERRRLVHELSYVTGERLAALRDDLVDARGAVTGSGSDPATVHAAFARAREELDDLLERFRSVARGVYPAVLRDEGLAAALDEVAADLPRRVRLPAEAGPRVAWELESGLYYLAASVLRALAGAPGSSEVAVGLSHGAGAVLLEVGDPAPPVDAERLRTLLADDAERVAALGGEVEVAATGSDGDAGRGARGLVVRAWVPDRIEPLVLDDVADSVPAGSGPAR